MTDSTAVTGTPTNDAGNATADDQTVTTTAADTQTPDASAPTDKPVEPPVPEAYEFAMPEGVDLDKASADEFTTVAKELKLTQEQAQKVADVAAKQAQRQIEAHANLVASWVEQVKTDKEIGGDKLEENLGVARKALETFGTPELRDVLNATGFGNHPEIIKAFYKAGKAISEDTFVKGAPRGPETDMAKKMFPSMN